MDKMQLLFIKADGTQACNNHMASKSWATKHDVL